MSENKYYLDNTPPRISFKPNGIDYSQEISTKVNVEDLNDVVDIRYQWSIEGISNNEWKKIETSSQTVVLPANSQSGEWYLTVEAIDAMGNKSVSQSEAFYYDAIKPECVVESKDIFTDTRDVVCHITATDSYPSDFEGYMSYKLGTNSWTDYMTYNSSFEVVVPEDETIIDLFVKVMDKAGNISEQVKITIHINEAAPTYIEYAVEGGLSDEWNSEIWVNENVTATLRSVEENESIDILNHNSSDYTFMNNGYFDFVYEDSNGKLGVKRATVSNIDKDPPKVEVVYDKPLNQWTNNYMMAEVNIMDENDPYFLMSSNMAIYQLDQKKLASRGHNVLGLDTSTGNLESTTSIDIGLWNENTIIIEFTDRFNNNGSTVVEAYNHDDFINETNETNLVSSAVNDNSVNVEYPISNPIIYYLGNNRNEALRIKDKENSSLMEFIYPYELIIPENSDTSIYHGEKLYKTVVDKAGNEQECYLELPWDQEIPEDIPESRITYSTTEWTNENVTVTVELLKDNVITAIGDQISYWYEESDGLIKTSNQDIFSHTFTENGSYVVYVGKTGADQSETIYYGYNLRVDNIDRVAPTGVIHYVDNLSYNQALSAYVLAEDNCSVSVSIYDNNNSLSTGIHPFSSNEESYEFHLRDEAGNETILTAFNMNEIYVETDYELEYSNTSFTTDPVIVSLLFEDTNLVTGISETYEIINNNGYNSYTFIENGSFTFYFKDSEGQVGAALASVDNIKKGVGTCVVDYYIGEHLLLPSEASKLTKEDIIAVIRPENPEEVINIINNEGSHQYTFSENGEFNFLLSDEIGNEKVVSAAVYNIDKQVPIAVVTQTPEEATSLSVSVQILIDKIVEVSDILESSVSVFDEMDYELVPYEDGMKISFITDHNMEIEFIVIDEVGNILNIPVIIDQIDVEPPIGFIVYSKETNTNGFVTATLHSNEEISITNYNSYNYVFHENGTFTFEFEDVLGQVGSTTATVNWIDKTPPVVSVEYSTTELTREAVIVTLIADEPINVLSGLGQTSIVFYENQEVTYIVSDLAGNQVLVPINIKNIDCDPPNLILNGEETVIIELYSSYMEQGYQAIDLREGDLTDKVSIQGYVNVAKTGNYILTYSVVDSLGNYSEMSRLVKVIGPTEGESALYVNYQLTSSDMVYGYGHTLTLHYYSDRLDEKIYVLEGYHLKGNFKVGGLSYVGSISVMPGDIYTIYIENSDMESRLVHVYMIDDEI